MQPFTAPQRYISLPLDNAPLIGPLRVLAAGKRRPAPASDPEDDDAMQGKDVPTTFKRARQDDSDDEHSVQTPATSGSARFISMHPGVYFIPTPGLYPDIGSFSSSITPPMRTLGNISSGSSRPPAMGGSAADMSAAGFGHGLSAPRDSGVPLGRSQLSQQPQGGHAKRFSAGAGVTPGPGLDDASDDADEEDGAGTDAGGPSLPRAKDKGKRRMSDGSSRRRTPPGQPQRPVSPRMSKYS